MKFDRLRHGARLALAACLLFFTIAMPALASGRHTDATRQGVGRSSVLDAGTLHACALRGDGSLSCWGENDYGQTTPQPGKFIQLTGGRLHTCGVRSDGSGACWGQDFQGSTNVPAGSYRQLDTSFVHTCGISDAGGLACWGNNGNGQTQAPAGVFTQVSAGYYHSCAVRGDGTLACWGFAAYGLTNPPAGRFVEVSSGIFHSCGVREDGTAACWGENSNGQATAPTGTFAHISSFAGGNCGLRSDGTAVCWGSAPAAPAGQFVEVTAGEDFACGLRENGSAECWGDNGSGRATPPAGSFGFGSISGGVFHTCGVNSDGTASCWGSNETGESTPPSGSFVQVQASYGYSCGLRSNGNLPCWGTGASGSGEASPPAGTYSQFSSALYHSCAVGTGGALACWGRDNYGQLTPPPGSFVQASVGFSSSCGLRADGSVACWGRDAEGQTSNVPAGSFVQLASGDFHHCGLRSDGAVLCWGDNSSGQTSAPAGSFRQISANSYETCGVRTDGSLACWGWNDSNQSNAPAGRFVQVGTGYFHACAIREDGMRVCWGNNDYGQAPPTDTTPPVIVPAVTGTLGDNGWYIGDVSISWSVTDAESGITSSTGCDATTLTTDALGAGYTCTATSGGGTSSQTVTVKRDATAPETTLTATPANPSNSATAAFEFTGSDALSGVAGYECSLDNGAFAACVSPFNTAALAEGSHDFAVRSQDNAGLFDATPASYTWVIDTDDTAPVIVPTVTGTLGNNGWYTSDVGISWSVTDLDSPISNQTGCNAVTLSSDAMSASYTCTATSIGGTSSETVTVKRDATAPTISAAATTAPNAAGWYRSNVAVGFTCNDALSGVVSCPTSQLLSTEGAAVSSSAQSITDQAGNSSTSNIVTVKLDKTAPTLAPSVSPNPLLLNATTNGLANGSDGLSGIAVQSCAALNTASVGSKSVACSVTDVAGNTTTANASYRVIYGFAGLVGFAPPRGSVVTWNVAQVKHAIPFTWRLLDANNADVNTLTNATITRTVVACPAKAIPQQVPQASYASPTTVQALGNGQYRQYWRITATLQGSCAQMTVNLGDGEVHHAMYKFE